ncbi:MAG: YceK/YidQ family lipoprotein [Verrucomicrobiales bacterium]|mgnify:FL=1|jgi:uncharacterized protein YceK|nr:YceK/YidQ family lipoprotein [Verrucomicrobiales bacterium]
MVGVRYARGVKFAKLKQKMTALALGVALIAGVGCSSMQSRTVLHQDGPYPGVRGLGQNYPKADWGAARYPAMLIDLPFSTVFDTLALPLDSLD